MRGRQSVIKTASILSLRPLNEQRTLALDSLGFPFDRVKFSLIGDSLRSPLLPGPQLQSWLRTTVFERGRLTDWPTRRLPTHRFADIHGNTAAVGSARQLRVGVGTTTYTTGNPDDKRVAAMTRVEARKRRRTVDYGTPIMGSLVRCLGTPTAITTVAFPQRRQAK